MKNAWFGPAIFAAMFMFCQVSHASVIYVKGDAAGLNNGSSWTNAFTSLEDGLAEAASGDEVWVAAFAGSYYPSNAYGLGVGSRWYHFELKNGVALYGGFVGTESDLSQRNVEVNSTILSGNVGSLSDDTDNCYHVFYNPASLALDSTAVLDGFTITAGYANGGGGDHANGGGMFNATCSPTIANCIFIGNASSGNGSGIYNFHSDPAIDNCVFQENISLDIYGGAGMFNYSSSPAVTNCRFLNNESSSSYGAALNNWYSEATFSNCSFVGNSAGNGGGAVSSGESTPTFLSCEFIGNSATDGGAAYNVSGTQTFINCTFSGNIADVEGGAVLCFEGEMVFRNCILWANTAPDNAEAATTLGLCSFRNCDIQGCGGSGLGWDSDLGTDAGGNIDAAPLFVDPVNGDLRLNSGSPCLDAGFGDAAPLLDKDGKPRCDMSVLDTGTGTPTYTDIGAYERQMITITYPNNVGCSCEEGKQVYVTYESELPLGTRLRIELVNSAGESWPLAANASKSPFKWQVGKWKSKTQAAYVSGDDYRIRISTLDDSVSNESQNEFAVGKVISLKVTGPDSIAGDVPSTSFGCVAHYDYGSDRDVTNEVAWSCTKIKGVKIGKKTGVLTKLPVTGLCTVTASYGKAKPPVTDSKDVTLAP